MYLMIKVIPSDMTNPSIGRRYSKVIVYSVCMNLQVDFVRVVSSCGQLQAYSPKQGLKNQARGQIVNCRWTDSFGELLVYLMLQNYDHVTIIIYKPIPYADSF